MIFRNEELFPAQVSPDGRYLALTELISADDNNLHVQNLTNGERTLITPHAGNVSSAPSDFPTVRRFYCTDESGEFPAAMRYDISGDKVVLP